MFNLVLTIFIKIHSWSETAINSLAVRANYGIHPKHRILNYDNFFLKNINRDDNVLDIGCAYGFSCKAIASKARKVIGIDLNAKSIIRAKKVSKARNISYIVGDATNFKFTEKFDVIILSNVLEHIENRIVFLKRIKTLAPKILIRVPMVDRDWLTVYKKEKGLDYLSDSTHFTEYTQNSFKEEMQKAGLFIDSLSVQFGEIWALVSSK
jgi:2-polyprenyl-3-methyl-5-hydroxy-6-metoxy-1,4-benzoquinol methylase